MNKANGSIDRIRGIQGLGTDALNFAWILFLFENCSWDDEAGEYKAAHKTHVNEIRME